MRRDGLAEVKAPSGCGEASPWDRARDIVLSCRGGRTKAPALGGQQFCRPFGTVLLWDHGPAAEAAG